jgi:cell wall-associated NlpC family hydrolase
VKLLIIVFAAFSVVLVMMPMLTAVTIATHPWMAVGMLTGPIQVVAPPPPPTPVPASAPAAPGPVPIGGPPTVAADVVQIASSWLGVPYVFGGCSRTGVDCSCLVMLVYRAVGVSLPRIASDQFNATTRLSREQLQPGDLVFFANTYEPGISHVGIYIGGGLQINAPTEGQVVSIAPVFTGYWGAHYAGAGRVKR